MRLTTLNTVSDAKSSDDVGVLATLVSQVRVAIVAGVDDEFLADPEVAALEVTASQFAIIRNVLKGSASSACELCSFMDYDRGAMSRMIDRLEKKGLLRRKALAHTRRTMALEVTDAGRAAYPKMQSCVSRVVGRMLKGVSKSQVKEAEMVLRRMLANS